MRNRNVHKRQLASENLSRQNGSVFGWDSNLITAFFCHRNNRFIIILSAGFAFFDNRIIYLFCKIFSRSSSLASLSVGIWFFNLVSNCLNKISYSPLLYSPSNNPNSHRQPRLPTLHPESGSYRPSVFHGFFFNLTVPYLFLRFFRKLPEEFIVLKIVVHFDPSIMLFLSSFEYFKTRSFRLFVSSLSLLL